MNFGVINATKNQLVTNQLTINNKTMGLDITSSNNDYMRFNWSGCTAFLNWCDSNKLPEPFIAWTGDNSGDELNLHDNKKHIKMAKEWMKKFKEKYPQLVTKQKPGQKTQLLIWGIWPWKKENENIEETKKRIADNFELGQAVAWYNMLQEAIKNKTIISYC